MFWLGIRGARSAVVRPNAFLRRKSAAFSACNVENIRKCNRHGGGAAAGVSHLSSPNRCTEYFLNSKTAAYTVPRKMRIYEDALLLFDNNGISVCSYANNIRLICRSAADVGCLRFKRNIIKIDAYNSIASKVICCFF